MKPIYVALLTSVAACKTGGGAGIQSSNMAETGSSTCTYEQVDKAQPKGVQALTEGQDFDGLDRGERLNLTKQGATPHLTATTYLDLAADPYQRYEITCESHFNCSASRTTFAPSGPRTAALKITPGGATVFAYAKRRPIFRYANTEAGFELWLIKDLNGSILKKGTVIRCARN